MGSALAFPARENGHEVRLVGTHLDSGIIDTCRSTNRHPKLPVPFPEGVSFHRVEEAEAAIKGADLVIGGVSSFGISWFGDRILPLIPEDTPVLSVTKGLMDLEDGTLITYPELWKRKLAERGKKLSLNAVGGPCTSYELAQHDQTEVAFCGEDPEILKRLRELLSTDYYHISISTDVTGVESAVALKNGYALAVALTIGLNKAAYGDDSPLHYNSQAAVFGQAAREMKKLLDLQGAGSLDNLCVGIGDLYVTVYGGRTRLVGILLGKGYSIGEAKEELNGVTLESLVVAERVARAVRKLSEAGRCDISEFPLLMCVDGIISEGKRCEIPWDSFRYEKI